MMRLGVAVLALVAALVLAEVFMALRPAPEPEGGADGALVIPELSPAAQAGEQVFAGNCARCHGETAAGGAGGPPLVHRIYEPSHHGDMAFRLAVRQGVRAHHWDFGDMPAIPGVSAEETDDVIAYVRELQRANGIE